MNKKIYSILDKVFGYKSFRPQQLDIINNILDKKDTLAVMPTGAGKSICYQIPALIFDGLTIVVSPLISLMKDQVEQLTENGVKAVYLNSTLKAQEYRDTVEKIVNNQVSLLYIAPESLMNERTVELLSNVKVSLFAIDEAHCISEWGHDFRLEYRKLNELREQYKGVPFAAFTATATPRVQNDIIENLSFVNYKKFVGSFDRNNLFIQVIQKHQPLNQVLDFLDKYPGQPGIIYCATRKNVESLCSDLKSYGYSAEPYHAGLADSLRMENQLKFQKDDVQIIVATIAFGMGINKSNVRFVIHYDLPKNLESYYQEIGRAGRDGLRAHCLMLFSYKDVDKIKYFITQKTSDFDRKLAYHHLNALLDYAEFYQCRRIPMLEYFGETYKNKNCGMCDNCNGKDSHMFNLTVPAQKYMSCIVRTGQSFPESYVIDVLLGKNDPKVKEFNHQELSTFGIGKEYTKRQWTVVSNQLLKAGFISQEENRGPVMVTSKGMDILKNRELFFGFIPKEETGRIKIPDADNLKYDEALLRELKAVRKLIADRQSIPPYIIFSDHSLVEMAATKPVNKADMLQINGVGEVKYEKYGSVFINTITAYAEADKLPNVNPAPKPEISNTIKTVGDRLNDGYDIMDLMTETKLKKTTIIKYIVKYSDAGYTVNDDVLSSLIEAGKTAKEKSSAVLKKNSYNIDASYRELVGTISYDDLSLLKIKEWQNNSGN